MKIEIKITDELGNVQIHNLRGYMVSPDAIEKEANKYQSATSNKMAMERVAFGQGALWVRSLFLAYER